MTTETKTFISAEDVLALHFECKKCGATVSRRIGECHVIPDLCANCKQKWMDGSDSALSRTLDAFQNLTQQIAETTKNREFILRIQVARPEESIKPSASQK